MHAKLGYLAKTRNSNQISAATSSKEKYKEKDTDDTQNKDKIEKSESNPPAVNNGENKGNIILNSEI